METEPGEGKVLNMKIMGIVVQNPTIPVFQEEVMENDAYLQNRHKDVKKWYNSQPELKQQYETSILNIISQIWKISIILARFTRLETLEKRRFSILTVFTTKYRSKRSFYKKKSLGRCIIYAKAISLG